MPFRKLEKAVAVQNSLLWKGFPANFDAAGKFFPDCPAARNAIPAKVWALSGNENGYWKIGAAFGNAVGFLLRDHHSLLEFFWAMTRLIPTQQRKKNCNCNRNSLGDRDRGGSNLRKLEGGENFEFRGAPKIDPLRHRDSIEKCQFGGQKSKCSRGSFRGKFPPLQRSVRFDPPPVPVSDSRLLPGFHSLRIYPYPMVWPLLRPWSQSPLSTENLRNCQIPK